MSDRQKRLYVIAVYLAIALLGVIAVLLAIYVVGDETWPSVLFNLGTELLGAVVISLMLILFLLQDWKVSERVEQIDAKLASISNWNLAERLNHIDTRLNALESPSATSFFIERPSLGAQIHDASRIDLSGVTLTTTLERHRRRLLEKLQAGAHIRLLIIDSKSEAILTATRKSGSISDDFYRRRLAETDEHIGWLYANWKQAQQSSENARKGSLEVGCLPYVPSFRIDSFGTRDAQDFSEDPNGIVYVEVYPHKEGDDPPPVFGLTLQQDGEWYKYFVNQFEAMWSDATQWQPLQRRLIIESARYGAPDGWNDVAEFLKERILARGLEVRVANDILGGDPKPGTPKKLKVVYTYDGETHSMELEEGHILRLP